MDEPLRLCCFGGERTGSAHSSCAALWRGISSSHSDRAVGRTGVLPAIFWVATCLLHRAFLPPVSRVSQQESFVLIPFTETLYVGGVVSAVLNKANNRNVRKSSGGCLPAATHQAGWLRI